MTGINTYLNNICNNEGFDAYLTEDENLFDLYNESDDAFCDYCEAHNIDLEVIDEDVNESEFNLWAWDHE